MAQMMTRMAGKGMRERMKMVRELQSGMMNNPNGLATQESRHRQTALLARERAKLKKAARKGTPQAETRAKTRARS